MSLKKTPGQVCSIYLHHYLSRDMKWKYQPHTVAYQRTEKRRPQQPYKVKLEDSLFGHVTIRTHFFHRMRERLTHKNEVAEKDLTEAIEEKQIRIDYKNGFYKFIGKKSTYIMSMNYELITMYPRDYSIEKYNKQKREPITEKQYKYLIRGLLANVFQGRDKLTEKNTKIEGGTS